MLYSGSISGTIHGWDIDGLVEKLHVAGAGAGGDGSGEPGREGDGGSSVGDDGLRGGPSSYEERGSLGTMSTSVLGSHHTDAVLCLLPLDSLDLLASGSMDGMVRLWDLRSGAHRRVLGAGPAQSLTTPSSTFTPSSGVRHLAYAKEQRFLLTAGFDRTIRVYNPFVNTLILTLRGETSCSLSYDDL